MGEVNVVDAGELWMSSAFGGVALWVQVLGHFQPMEKLRWISI